MESLDPILVERFKEVYLELYGEKLGTKEAEKQLREIVVVLRATKIKRSQRKNGK
jgi:hypothetical protein